MNAPGNRQAGGQPRGSYSSYRSATTIVLFAIEVAGLAGAAAADSGKAFEQGSERKDRP